VGREGEGGGAYKGGNLETSKPLRPSQIHNKRVAIERKSFGGGRGNLPKRAYSQIGGKEGAKFER